MTPASLSTPVSRPLFVSDGPQGVANGNTDVTCWPSALTVVQSWDPELMAEYGAGMGLEQYKKGTNFMLGPGVNLARLPWNGRNLCVVALSEMRARARAALSTAASSPTAPAASTRARIRGWQARWSPRRSGASRARTSPAA